MPGYCRLTDLEFNPADAHGCPACAHTVTGPSVSGSPDTYINGLNAMRAQGVDNGVHCCCCGSNTWITCEGSPDTYINGFPSVRLGDFNTCCGGGPAHMITCSGDTFDN